MTYFSVTQVAAQLGKSEETIKRWLRSGKRFPNAFKISDTEGWRIPAGDLLVGQAKSPPHQEQLTTDNLTPDYSPQDNLTELVTLAYQAVTLTYPTEEIVNLLREQGLRRSLQILLTMNQSKNKVKSPVGFIRACIKGNWTSDTLPEKIDRRHVSLEQKLGFDSDTNVESFPFYNWLEADS